MVELCDQQKGVIKPVTSQLSLASQLESVASGNGHPGVAVTDAGRHVCTPEIRMPSPRAFSRVPVDPFVGRLADATPGCPDASQRQAHPRLGAELEPFTVDIGPVALSRSAALARVWPHDAPLDPPLPTNLRVRAGLTNAGLVLPEATETYFPHMSAAYGDGRHPLPQRNEPGRRPRLSPATPRPPSRDRARQVRVAGEGTQHPDRRTYTFERIQELPLGR
ncbi:hypothetical protein a10_01503 [Streptomyces acidiscabies]|uniref:Uncharacterized protein n=1 Tax=Streptomyces scabiei TaxID=1930 RepID=A0A100JKU7_STRSC|nr:hypothetical protein a10_01503 [Streptomyces acidiscabies]GAQ61287.1 hypothetical protein SsS58_01636 [Streptomyces scabiei]